MQITKINQVGKSPVCFSGKKYEYVPTESPKSNFMDKFEKNVNDVNDEIFILAQERAKCVLPAWIPFSKAAKLDDEIRKKEAFLAGFERARPIFENEQVKSDEFLMETHAIVEFSKKELYESANRLREKLDASNLDPAERKKYEDALERMMKSSE